MADEKGGPAEANSKVLRGHIIEPWELRSENGKQRRQIYLQEFYEANIL